MLPHGSDAPPAADLVHIGRGSRLSERVEAEVAKVEGSIAEFASGLSVDEREAFESILGSRNSALAALGGIPAEQILTVEELEIFRDLLSRAPTARRELPSQVVLIMKATRLCNLRCTYCRSWSVNPNQVMGFEVLAHTIHGVLTAAGVCTVQFIWHGGEPTLRPHSFYYKALWLQQQFRRPGQSVSNSMQTNGTHLTDRWLTLLKRYDVGVGVSLDGPPEIHDGRRLDTAGRATSGTIIGGLRRLQERGIRHGVAMVIDDAVVRLGAQRMLDYLLGLGVRKVSLISVVPEGDPTRAERLGEPYLDHARFVEYLRALFRLWFPAFVHRIRFREISDLLGKVAGGPSAHCVSGPNCIGRFFTIEPNGEVSHCDLYQQNPAFRFGNVLETPLGELPGRSPALLRAHGYTAAGLDLCRGCRWFQVCQGGCPYRRYVRVVWRNGAADERCCGLAPLLSDMADALGSSPAESTAS